MCMLDENKNSETFKSIVNESYWLSDVALALKQDDKNYKSKELSKKTLATIQTMNKSKSFQRVQLGRS